MATTQQILQTLSLRASSITHLLGQHPKLAIATPCGSGKTYATAEFISIHWRQGVVYVAKTVAELQRMRALLIDLAVPAWAIQTFAESGTGVSYRSQLNTHPVVLVTHQRLLIDSPTAFVHFGMPLLQPRCYLFIDEALPPLLIMQIPNMAVRGYLATVGVDLKAVLSPQDAWAKVLALSAHVDRDARAPLRALGIRYIGLLTEELAYFNHQTVIEMRKYALQLALYQLLIGNRHIDDAHTHVLVPLAPHQAWIKLFPHVIVTDATAGFTRFLYEGYHLHEQPFNFGDIDYLLHHLSEFDLSKTNTQRYRESFFEVDVRAINSILRDRDYGFRDPYLITWKAFKDDMRSKLGLPVEHYGSNVGSNEFMDRDSVVLIGAHRLPVKFVKVARLIYPAFDEVQIALAVWIQELYRSRIRRGQPVCVYLVGDRCCVEAFKRVLQRPFWPSALATHGRTAIDIDLTQLKGRLQREIVSRLKTRGECDKKAIAALCKYDYAKVDRAINGLLIRHPTLEPWLVITTDRIEIRDTLPKPMPR